MGFHPVNSGLPFHSRVRSRQATDRRTDRHRPSFHNVPPYVGRIKTSVLTGGRIHCIPVMVLSLSLIVEGVRKSGSSHGTPLLSTSAPASASSSSLSGKSASPGPMSFTVRPSRWSLVSLASLFAGHITSVSYTHLTLPTIYSV